MRQLADNVLELRSERGARFEATRDGEAIEGEATLVDGSVLTLTLVVGAAHC